MGKKPYAGVVVRVMVRVWPVGLKGEVHIESVSQEICIYGGGRKMWVPLRMSIDYRGVPQCLGRCPTALYHLLTFIIP